VAKPPASETGLIIPVRLPAGLQSLRRRAIDDASHGLPAHVSLLYPFVPPDALDRPLRAAIVGAVGRHARFPYRLVGPARWPDVLYASVDGDGPFRALQADLAHEFPQFPIYGGAFAFEPHVTIAKDLAATNTSLDGDPAWESLPATLVARSVELIVKDGSGWRVHWRFRMRRPIRVLVCGERLRGDDAAAPLAVEMLTEEVRSLAELVEVGQLSVEALLDVPAGMGVIVADAAAGVEPGSVVTLPLEELARPRVLAGGPRRGQPGPAPASSHSLPPDQVVALATELRGSPPRGVFVGIGGADFAFGERLSRPVRDGLPAFTAAIAAEIRRLATE
jgi:hydrogenase maturation protease